MNIHKTHSTKTTDEANAEKREFEKDCHENIEPILAKQAHFKNKREKEKEKQEQQKRYLKILMFQLQAMECNLKVMRELNKVGGLKLDLSALNKVGGLKLDLSALEHEIVVVLETIEDLEGK